MDIEPIKTDSDYRATLREIERLMTAQLATPEGERLDFLVTLVEAYEQRHFPLDPPDRMETSRTRMERNGLMAETP